MQDEFNALQNKGKRQLVPGHPAQNLIRCKWVFCIKRKPDAFVDRYNAQLVAKEYNQVEGIDYNGTFYLVAKPVTIRILLTLVVHSNWFLHQLDVSNAFLHGFLKENVFMSQPSRFFDQEHPFHVCPLKKSMYGLKQTPRAWFEKLQSALTHMGFKASHQPTLVLVLVYVDDIIVTDPSSTACKSMIFS